jgi:UDPglucose--hexose-1-phosphate uridylyltransferase
MISETIEKLLVYAKLHLGMKEEDEDYLRNLFLSYCEVKEPFTGKVDEKKIANLLVPDSLVAEMVAYFVSTGNPSSLAERRATYMMGVVSPLPSVTDENFKEIYKRLGPQKACEYLYDLSIKNDYIAKSKVDKNIIWNASYSSGSPLEISINLSKPEKNNKDIAKLVSAPVSSSYPKCLLCKENLGFEGNDKHPARENIRFIPLSLNGERWYLQYSPYVYYHQHCICFYEKHVPMEISPRIFHILFAFQDLFPNFFIGSNSDLPIVGGSILNHEHFQGGGHLLPLLLARDLKVIPTKLKKTKLSIVNFYDTALRLTGKDSQEIIEAASVILKSWHTYDDPSNEIISHDEKGQHSTITPLLRKNGENYEMTLILRNNRCDEQYPDGIFHAHPEFHHIKSEGIGLIEAAGLFILPARLLRQGHEVEDVVKRGLTQEEYLKIYPDLSTFSRMVNEMKETGESAQTYMGLVCREILRNVAVFKDDEKGQEGLTKFIKEVSL